MTEVLIDSIVWTDGTQRDVIIDPDGVPFARVQCCHCDRWFFREWREVRTSARLGRRVFCSARCSALGRWHPKATA